MMIHLHLLHYYDVMKNHHTIHHLILQDPDLYWSQYNLMDDYYLLVCLILLEKKKNQILDLKQDKKMVFN
jgi:hypothetical protein